MNLISFKFSGFSGDVIHYMAGIKQVCEELQSKAEIYLWLDQMGACYQGAVHPYEGKMINQYAFDMLKPLLMAQDYVDKVEPWAGQEITVDLDKIRQMQMGMPYGSLSHWVGMAFPDMQCDLSQAWLWADHKDMDDLLFDLTNDKILINRTSRYQQPYISYFFMEKYKDRLVFIGLEKEHQDFQNTWKFELPHIIVNNFNDLAQCLHVCKFFIGNQSMCFAIAEGLKVPRILECAEYAPNVHPIGEHAHYFMFQEGLTYLVDHLDKTL